MPHTRRAASNSPPCPATWVGSGAWGPDVARLATASEDGTAIIWPGNDDTLQQLAACRIWRGFTVDELTQYGVRYPTARVDQTGCPPPYQP